MQKYRYLLGKNLEMKTCSPYFSMNNLLYLMNPASGS
jgi:hypothetical protein